MLVFDACRSLASFIPLRALRVLVVQLLCALPSGGLLAERRRARWCGGRLVGIVSVEPAQVGLQILRLVLETLHRVEEVRASDAHAFQRVWCLREGFCGPRRAHAIEPLVVIRRADVDHSGHVGAEVAIRIEALFATLEGRDARAPRARPRDAQHEGKHGEEEEDADEAGADRALRGERFVERDAQDIMLEDELGRTPLWEDREAALLARDADLQQRPRWGGGWRWGVNERRECISVHVLHFARIDLRTMPG